MNKIKTLIVFIALLCIVTGANACRKNDGRVAEIESALTSTGDPENSIEIDYVSPKTGRSERFSVISVKSASCNVKSEKSGLSVSKEDFTDKSVSCDTPTSYSENSSGGGLINSASVSDSVFDFDFTSVTKSVTKSESKAHSHSLKYNELIEPTCSISGVKAHWHCSECGKNYAEETAETELCDLTVLPLNHVYVGKIQKEQSVENYYLTGGSPFTFELNGSVYRSSNKEDRSSSTMTLTAKRAFSLEVQYKVSSEEDADFLIIKHNSVQKVKISGTADADWKCVIFELEENDVVTFSYSKDGSLSYGDDCALIQFLTPEKSSAIVEVDGLVSALIHVDAVPETSASAGKAEHWHCTLCGKNFSDETARNEIPDLTVNG